MTFKTSSLVKKRSTFGNLAQLVILNERTMYEKHRFVNY